MKVSGSVAVGVIVAAVIVVCIAGFFYVRHATGNDVADQLHAEMRKLPPGRSPITPEQIEKMRQRQSGGNISPVSPR